MGKLKILIYGAGAVGLGVASCLLKTGQEVTILGREETISLLKRKGLIRTGIFGELTASPGSFEAVTSLKDIAGGPYDYILVATKSFDSEKAARDIQAHQHLLGPECCLILFQNGWGNAEIFSRYFDKKIVCNARVITGFIRPESNHVDITVHADAIHIGRLSATDSNKISPLCEGIALGGIPCEPVEDIAGDLWAKMLFNCPLNSVGAVCGVPYGALGKSRWSRKTMERIIREIFLILKAGGYSSSWESPEAYIDFFYGTLIPRTAEHFSSTLQDLRAGKPTEIDSLNGAVVRLAESYGVDVPANETVYNLIKFIEGNQTGS
jgi:2-dehydropantoate 2-reductase